MSAIPRQEATSGTSRSTRPGSIRQVRLRLWWATQEAAELLDVSDSDTKLNAISALSTACGAYGNLIEAHTLEAEVDAMQKELHELREARSRPARAGGRAARPAAN